MKFLAFIKRHGNLIGLFLILLTALLSALIYQNFYSTGIRHLQELSGISRQPSIDVNEQLFGKIVNDLEARRSTKPPPTESNPFR